jgi:hypothetical protein
MYAALQGPFDQQTGLMDDDLRQQDLLPVTEPYSGQGYVHIGGGGETVSADRLEVEGHQAVVDWIVIELRDATNPAQVVITKSALLTRNGTVESADGGELLFPGFASGSYHVAIRHRNHLGVMTKQPLQLDAVATPIDFTSGLAGTYGTSAEAQLGSGFYALWAGNVNADKTINYKGTVTDRTEMLPVLNASDLTNTAVGYFNEDINMDGIVKYVGKNNDRAIILRNLGGLPGAAVTEQIP